MQSLAFSGGHVRRSLSVRSARWDAARGPVRNPWARERLARGRNRAARPFVPDIAAEAADAVAGLLAEPATLFGVVIPIRTASAEQSLTLFSTAFDDGGRIPERYTLEGEDLSPPLVWRGAPEATRSFALVCDDPDAPVCVWHHWAIYDISPNVAGLDEGFSTEASAAAVHQAINDFGTAGYEGPCPPLGHGTHHYRFTLYALDVARLDLEAGARVRAVARAARAHALAQATLIGTYSR